MPHSKLDITESVWFRRGVTKVLTFSGVEFDHIKRKNNLLKRVITFRKGYSSFE
jgi:hypothetical protein